MSREVIAVIRLSPGEVGYYDDLSRIHLTASDPQRNIFAGTNCTQLRRSVKSGRLRLLFGSLGGEVKTDYFKKGNRYAGQLADSIQAANHSQTIDTTIEPVRVVSAESESGHVEESGVVEITPTKSAVEENAHVGEPVPETHSGKESANTVVEESAPAEKTSTEEIPATEIAAETVPTATKEETQKTSRKNKK